MLWHLLSRIAISVVFGILTLMTTAINRMDQCIPWSVFTKQLEMSHGRILKISINYTWSSNRRIQIHSHLRSPTVHKTRKLGKKKAKHKHTRHEKNTNGNPILSTSNLVFWPVKRLVLSSLYCLRNGKTVVGDKKSKATNTKRNP